MAVSLKSRIAQEQKQALQNRQTDETIAFENGSTINLTPSDEPIVSGAEVYAEDDDDIDPSMWPWYVRLNPCTIARYKVLAPLGDAVAKLAVECPCCNGFRMLAALVVGIGVGLTAGLLL